MTQGAHRLRSTMVAVELAAALVLLVGAGLAIHSFQKLLDVNPGFDANGLVTVSTQMPPGASTAQQQASLYEGIRQSLLATPGVIGVDAVTRLPLMGSNLGTTISVEGITRPGDALTEVEYRRATPTYFSTMRIPLLRGRFLDDHDDRNKAVVNRAFERRFWPNGSAIGKRFKDGPPYTEKTWTTIVGVVGDVHHFGLDAAVRPEIYRGYAIGPFFAPILVIRTSGNTEALLAGLAAKIRSVDAAMPAYDIFPMPKLLSRSAAPRRFLMWLLTGFAATALLLAAVGVYGAMSQMVARRSQEIGLRMALGASPFEALLLVFGDGMRLAAIGIGVGVLAALAVTRLMQGLLFEVQALDPVVFAGAAAVLAAVGALACYVPARAATKVDPVETLRG
jgi:putative ABC transport system permease protein